MKHTKKIRGGWNYFKRRDFSQKEINLFTLIKQIRGKLICDGSVLEQVSYSRDIFENNINLYIGLLEEFRDGVKNSLTNGSNFFSDLVANDSSLKDYLSRWINNVNMKMPNHLHYGLIHTQEMVNVNNDKILYAFLILELKQLRDLKINLEKKLKSISGKKSHWFSSMFIRLPDGMTRANLNGARESLRIKEEIKHIIKKFCNVNIDSFYASFYNYIRQFKLNLSSSDKKKAMEYITDIFEIINKNLNGVKMRSDSPYNSPDNSDNSSLYSHDISENSSVYDLHEEEEEELPSGGKRTKKIGRKKSRKIK